MVASSAGNLVAFFMVSKGNSILWLDVMELLLRVKGAATLSSGDSIIVLVTGAFVWIAVTWAGIAKWFLREHHSGSAVAPFESRGSLLGERLLDSQPMGMQPRNPSVQGVVRPPPGMPTRSRSRGTGR